LGCQEGFPGRVIIAHVSFSHVVMHLSQFFVISCFKRAMQHAPMTRRGRRTSLERAMHEQCIIVHRLPASYFTVNVTLYQFVWEAVFVFFQGIF
jgi:hypothetical protein